MQSFPKHAWLDTKFKPRMTKRIVVVGMVFRDLETQKIDNIFDLDVLLPARM
jgi:hypothetical protein